MNHASASCVLFLWDRELKNAGNERWIVEYLADAVCNPVIRFDLIEMSRQWRELAAQIEFLEKVRREWT
jgi:hypothetical protein